MLPQFAAGVPALQGREPIPVGPLVADTLFPFDHILHPIVPAGSSQEFPQSLRHRLFCGLMSEWCVEPFHVLVPRWKEIVS